MMLINGDLSERCVTLATYLVKESATVRETANKFGIGKSTVHKDIKERLKSINGPLYEEAVKVLDKNKSERHIRGGIATKNKYLDLKKRKNTR